jgi:hypothetical protein
MPEALASWSSSRYKRHPIPKHQAAAKTSETLPINFLERRPFSFRETPPFTIRNDIRPQISRPLPAHIHLYPTRALANHSLPQPPDPGAACSHPFDAACPRAPTPKQGLEPARSIMIMAILPAKQTRPHPVSTTPTIIASSLNLVHASCRPRTPPHTRCRRST